MCFGLGVESGLIDERKKGTKRKKRKSFENLRKWICWSRLKWNDGSKIGYEKIYTKGKILVEKELKKNIFNKN